MSKMCVCSDSHNNVPLVAQRYGTIAAHTRGRSSILVVFVVFCVHMNRFASFDKADATADIQWHCNHQPPLWYHYIPGCGYPGLLDRKKMFGHVQKSQKLGFKGHADNNRVRQKQWRDLKKPEKYRELGVPHRTKKRVRHNYSYITSSLAFQKSWEVSLLLKLSCLVNCFLVRWSVQDKLLKIMPW